MNQLKKIGWFQTVPEYVRCSTQYCSVYGEEEKMMIKQLNNLCMALDLGLTPRTLPKCAKRVLTPQPHSPFSILNCTHHPYISKFFVYTQP